jgi:hypothetical protein
MTVSLQSLLSIPCTGSRHTGTGTVLPTNLVNNNLFPILTTGIRGSFCYPVPVPVCGVGVSAPLVVELRGHQCWRLSHPPS